MMIIVSSHSWRYYDFDIATLKDCFNVICEPLDIIKIYKNNRSWLPAPWKLSVLFRIFQRLPVFCRRIAPPFWTGKNFRRVK
jgi:hypothetical protein